MSHTDVQEWEEYDARWLDDPPPVHMPGRTPAAAESFESPFLTETTAESATEMEGAPSEPAHEDTRSVSQEVDSAAGAHSPTSSERADLTEDEVALVLGRMPATLVLHRLLHSPGFRQAAAAGVLGHAVPRTVRVNGVEVSVPAYLRLVSRLCREAAEQSEEESRGASGYVEPPLTPGLTSPPETAFLSPGEQECQCGHRFSPSIATEVPEVEAPTFEYDAPAVATKKVVDRLSPEFWFLTDDEIAQARGGRGVLKRTQKRYTSYNLVKPLIDGETMMSTLHDDLNRMGKDDFFHFMAWRVVITTNLKRGTTPSLASRFDNVLKAASKRGAHLRALIWRLSDLMASFAKEHDRENRDGACLFSSLGGQGVLDDRLPAAASHHQKAAIILRDREAVAYCGSTDIHDDTWDTRLHNSDPRRMNFSLPGRHEVHLYLRGDAVLDMENNFRDRWHEREEPSDPPAPTRIKTPLPPVAKRPGTHHVQVLRTYPCVANASGIHRDFAPSGETTCLAGYLKAISLAQKYIYMEDQYMASDELAQALNKALATISKLILVVPDKPDEDDIPLATAGFRSHQARFLKTVTAGHPGKVHVFELVQPKTRKAIFVHSKLMIVDDIYAVAGSPNIDQRSMTADSELAAAVVDGDVVDGVCRFARDLRLNLWAEHLGVAQSDSSIADPIAGVNEWDRKAADPDGLVRTHAVPPDTGDLGMGTIDFDGRCPTAGAKSRVKSETPGEAEQPEFYAESARWLRDGVAEYEYRDPPKSIHVSDPFAVPFRWVCKVSILKNGKYDSGGSGVLISDRHVLTAAHVVYNVIQDPARYSLEVTIALDGSKDLGSHSSSGKPAIPSKYDPDQNDYDYALITLSRSVAGDKPRELKGDPLCFWGSPDCGAGTVLVRSDPKSLVTQTAYTAGYPKRHGIHDMWCFSGLLAYVGEHDRTMAYTGEATEGQSGSPVWIQRDGEYILVGIVVARGSTVRVVRVTRELCRQLALWMGSPQKEVAESEESSQALVAEEVEGSSPFAHEVLPAGTVNLEEHQVAPKGLALLDHMQIPKAPDPRSPGAFTTGTLTRLTAADLNPLFIDAHDNLITDTSATGLQHCVQVLLSTRFQGLLGAKGQTAGGPNDHVHVALVDLTGTKLTQPDFAGWGSTVAMYAASAAKILALYGAFQLRSDLRDLAARKSPADGIQLEKRAIAEWRAKGLSRNLPDLGWLFGIRHWTAGATLNFTSDAQSTFANIMHNCPAGTLIAKVGMPYIGSLCWQSGLYHLSRGGLWLRASYCDQGSWDSPIAAANVHNVTALSAATYFTLLAQGRLVDDASSADIGTALKQGCVSSLFPSLPVVASKCGIYSGYVHDCAWIQDEEVRYVIAVLSRLETGAQAQLYSSLCTELDLLVRQNNRRPKASCP